MIKKYLLILSLLINVLFTAFFVKRHYSYYQPVAGPNDSMVTYRYNKYNVFKSTQEFYNLLPISSTDIVFIGNSLIASFPVELFNDGRIKNRGIAGTNTFDLLKRIPIIVKSKPAKCFIMDGINDITQGISAEKTLENMNAVITLIKSQSPQTQIYIHSILPNSSAAICKTIQDYNIRLKALASRQSVTYINLFPYFFNGAVIKPELTVDGTHLRVQGYLIWKEVLKNDI